MATGNSLIQFTGKSMEPPSSNYAQVVIRNGIFTLAFDAATAESVVFRGVLPSHYSGGGLTIDIYWMAASATSGDVVWGVEIERAQDGGTDQDADSFATQQTATGTANGTSGIKTKTTVTCSSGANMDSLAAGEPFRLRLQRVAASGSDTMTGDAQFCEMHLKET